MKLTLLLPAMLRITIIFLRDIDSAYKNFKYKKIKDILLRDIKNGASDFTENEIKQKLDLHNKEELKLLLIKE